MAWTRWDHQPPGPEFHDHLQDGIEEALAGGGNGGSQTALIEEITQAAHGFAVGDLIRHSDTGWVLSEADAAANADVDAIVSAVGGTDTFTATYQGKVTGLSGLTPGDDYFLSATTAGAFTATEPTATDQVSEPVLKALSATTALFKPLRGLVQPAAATKDLLYKVLDDSTAITVATLADFVVGSDLDGWSLTGVECAVSTAPGTSAPSVTVKKNGTDMLSTDVSIDVGEKTSSTAATPAVIKADGTQTVATGDVLAFAGVTADSGAADRGLQFRLTFTSP